MAREVWFEECGGVQAVCVSGERVEFIAGTFAMPAVERETMLAHPFDDEQQAWVWDALSLMPEELLPAALELVGAGYVIYRAEGGR